jgi:4-hydroxymandelate oxidase
MRAERRRLRPQAEPEWSDAEDVAAAAARRLHPAVHDYFAGGAGREQTLRDNADRWRAWRFRPSVLRDVSTVSTAANLLGAAVAAPVVVAPLGYQRLAHPDGEQATAQACATTGLTMSLSTYATTSIEDVAAVAGGGPLWFQTYVLRDRDVTAAMLERASAAGYRAVILTLDAPVVGRRLRDRAHGYWLPLADVRLSNFPAAHAQPTATYSTELETALTPELLQWVKRTSGLPLLVKGVLRGDDAVRCVEAGADGVVVSNHGGRQLDGAVSSADALEDVVAGLAGSCPVLVDGGVRSGADVLTARALGADGVLVGRAALWALACGGRAGVEAFLTAVVDELRHTMALCGLSDLTEVPRDLVRRGAR